MTQDLFISQAETGNEAEFVPLSETVQVVSDILEGRYDAYSADDFRFIGSIKNLKKVPGSAMIAPPAKKEPAAEVSNLPSN